MMTRQWVREKAWAVVLAAMILSLPGTVSGAISYSFDIFTDNGLYNDDPGVKLVAEVSGGFEQASFKFYNNSTVDCVIANIYFEDGSLLGLDTIVNGPNTLFINGGTPKNMPSANTLSPAFNATREFTTSADNPMPQNGISNVTVPAKKWLQLNFSLMNNKSIQDVYNELNSGTLRVGAHVIAFADGSSESAILVPSTGEVIPDNPELPEPVSLALLVTGAVALLSRRTA